MRELRRREVKTIVRDFLDHIAAHWDFYRAHLPHLARTLMYYDLFATVIRTLPEGSRLEFNPKYPLIYEEKPKCYVGDYDIKKAFGEKWTEEIDNLVYDAWAVTVNFGEPEEPIPDTPEALHEKYRDSIFPTVEDARRHMYEVGGTGYGWHDGKRMKLAACGTPAIFYRGFTTVKEFPAQKKLLDSVRNHPRVKLALQLRKKRIRAAKRHRKQVEASSKKLDGFLKEAAGLLKEAEELIAKSKASKE